MTGQVPLDVGAAAVGMTPRAVRRIVTRGMTGSRLVRRIVMTVGSVRRIASGVVVPRYVGRVAPMLRTLVVLAVCVVLAGFVVLAVRMPVGARLTRMTVLGAGHLVIGVMTTMMAVTSGRAGRCGGDCNQHGQGGQGARPPHADDTVRDRSQQHLKGCDDADGGERGGRQVLDPRVSGCGQRADEGDADAVGQRPHEEGAAVHQEPGAQDDPRRSRCSQDRPEQLTGAAQPEHPHQGRVAGMAADRRRVDECGHG